MPNQTKEDAFAHIVLAQTGTLAESPSEEFCLELRRQLYLWIERVDQELYRRDMEQMLRDEQDIDREEERLEEEFSLTHHQGA